MKAFGRLSKKKPTTLVKDGQGVGFSEAKASLDKKIAELKKLSESEGEEAQGVEPIAVPPENLITNNDMVVWPSSEKDEATLLAAKAKALAEHHDQAKAMKPLSFLKFTVPPGNLTPQHTFHALHQQHPILPDEDGAFDKYYQQHHPYSHYTNQAFVVVQKSEHFALLEFPSKSYLDLSANLAESLLKMGYLRLESQVLPNGRALMLCLRMTAHLSYVFDMKG